MAAAHQGGVLSKIIELLEDLCSNTVSCVNAKCLTGLSLLQECFKAA